MFISWINFFSYYIKCHEQLSRQSPDKISMNWERKKWTIVTICHCTEDNSLYIQQKCNRQQQLRKGQAFATTQMPSANTGLTLLQGIPKVRVLPWDLGFTHSEHAAASLGFVEPCGYICQSTFRSQHRVIVTGHKVTPPLVGSLNRGICQSIYT